MSGPEIKRGLRRQPDLETLYSVNADGSRNMLQPADASGRWHTRKTWVFALLIAFYLAVPWIKVGAYPALRLDIQHRTAYLVGHTFTREDFFLVFFLVTGFGFGLFAVTALFGRVWCGYACPQTVFLEGVYRRVERWIEGGRNERMRRNKGPWTFDKTWRKVVKQAAFIVITLVITHTALAYFLPVEELIPALLSGPSGHWLAFTWTIAATVVVYFDFAWFREQFCVIMCPYGRLQSALIDDDTIVVGYDATRGEPRGAKGKAEGDCIDCGSCVNVCPTGIDIRNGLQMECIGCTNCVDACDSIMRQVGRSEGLVRYDSLRGFKGGKHRWLRPRLFLYIALALVGLLVFGFTATARSSFDATVLRARGMPYTIDGDRIQNVFTIHLRNKSLEESEYEVTPVTPVDGTPRVEWRIPTHEIELDALGEVHLSLFAEVARSDYQHAFPIAVQIVNETSHELEVVHLQFRGP